MGKNSSHLVSVSTTNSGTYTSSVTWKDGYYQTHVDSYKYKNSTPIYEMIECNIARFYFDEPVNIRKTLADSYGTLATIKKVNSGNYEVDSHGNVNQYHYKNGSLVSASLFSKIRYEVVARNDRRLAVCRYPGMIMIQSLLIKDRKFYTPVQGTVFLRFVTIHRFFHSFSFCGNPGAINTPAQ